MSKFKPNPRSRFVSVSPKSTYTPDTKSASTAVLAEPEVAAASGEQPVQEVETNAIQRMGFLALLVFLFFKFSFFHEFLELKIGVDLHLIIILSILTLVCALGSGRIGFAFRDKLTWIWFGFVGCMGIATVTSVWPGGSFPEFTVYSRTVFPVVFVLPALTATKKDLSRVLGIIGVACVVAVALGFINSDFKSGRMSVDQGNSELTNSNDYAAYLTLMLPALAYLTLRPGRPKILNVFGIAVSGISIYEILSTGSRGGLIGVGVMLLFVAFVVKGRVRFAILVGIPVLTLASLPFIPQESAERLKTLFSSDNSSISGEAVESKEARMELLKESLRITWQHPLTGIGPDQFMVGQAESAKERGQRGMWHVTHNSWTQISSECGIPAALLYISAVVITFLRLFKQRKNPDKDVAAVALTGAIMLVGFSTCICFLSMGYAIQLLVLTGLANAVTIWAENARSLPAPQAVAA